MTGVVLIAAHGSHLDARSSEPVRRHADALRRSGRFDRVLTGFWKEEPALCRALDGIEAGPVVVVPFFMADGYFTRTVIPRELADDLYDKMVEYYKDNPNVTVIVDRREGPDRRSGQDGSEFQERRQTRDRRRARVTGTFPRTDVPE